MRIATSVYPLEWHETYDAYLDKLSGWVNEAAGNGADLVVFPEYAGVESALLGRPDLARADRDWVRVASPGSSGMMKFWHDLACDLKLHILAGTGPCRTDAGFVNRARLFAPNDVNGYQDKQILTPWERTQTSLAAGDGFSVFETTWGRIGVLICYDAEFPELARALEADILLVPACTDTRAGAERLRTACRARALENQCFVVLSSSSGSVPACDIVDENRGFAGIYTPPDKGFPDTGVLAESALDEAGWVYAEVDLEALEASRSAADAPLRQDVTEIAKPFKTPSVIHLKP